MVDVDEGCAMIRVRPNRYMLADSYLTMDLDYKKDFLGHETSMLRLSTIPVGDIVLNQSWGDWLLKMEDRG